MDYDIRKGQYANLEGAGLKNLMVSAFGSVKEENGVLISSFGAIAKIQAKVLDKNRIEIVADMDKSAAPDVQANTIKVWNQFLESATGFNSKERSKRLQKKAKDGKL
ncbi:MAG TPA: DUF5611 family protein [Methanomassiliicoccales archaeon]|nr:DUF5611 family protein [Methanomassiliicoccales archaeon]